MDRDHVEHRHFAGKVDRLNFYFI